MAIYTHATNEESSVDKPCMQPPNGYIIDGIGSPLPAGRPAGRKIVCDYYRGPRWLMRLFSLRSYSSRDYADFEYQMVPRMAAQCNGQSHCSQST